MHRWVVLAFLAAGCLSSNGDPSEAEPDNATLQTAGNSWLDCEQWHLHFDARAEDFAQDAPAGFTVSADSLGMTTLLIHVTLCPNVQEALLAVPVTPPVEHEDENRSEIAVVQVLHAGHGPHLYPHPFADRLVEATFERSQAPMGPSLRIVGRGETTDLATVLNPSRGSFPGESWARFAGGASALGVVTADGNVSTSLGFGPVLYRHQGPGGAPPATAGVAHLVTGLDVAFASEVYA